MREILSLTQGRSDRGKHPTELLLQSCKHFSDSACSELEGGKVPWKQMTTDRKGPLGSGKFSAYYITKVLAPKRVQQEKERQTGKVAPRGMGWRWVQRPSGFLLLLANLALTMLFELAETFPKKARGREEQRSATLGVNPCSIMICMTSGSLSIHRDNTFYSPAFLSLAMCFQHYLAYGAIYLSNSVQFYFVK